MAPTGFPEPWRFQDSLRETREKVAESKFGLVYWKLKESIRGFIPIIFFARGKAVSLLTE